MSNRVESVKLNSFFDFDGNERSFSSCSPKTTHRGSINPLNVPKVLDLYTQLRVNYVHFVFNQLLVIIHFVQNTYILFYIYKRFYTQK